MDFKFDSGDIIYFLREYSENLPTDEQSITGIIINRCNEGYWILWNDNNEINFMYDSKIFIEGWYEKVI
jgi:hypothetical protein